MSDNFLSRWSRRKQGLDTNPAPMPAPDTSAAAMPAPAVRGSPEQARHDAPARVAKDDAAAPADGAQPALPTMADVQGLTPSSDFQTFMRQGVPGEVRNAAMKKLFTDPHFNVMDGLDIYIGDYNTPDPLPAGMLEKMVGAQLLNLFPPKDPADLGRSDAAEGQPKSEPSPDATHNLPLVAKSPTSPTPPTLQAPEALQPSEPTAHDHPDLQLQPNHAPANPSPGSSTG